MTAADARATSINLAGAAITGAGASCAVSVSVVAASAGLYISQTSGVASNLGQSELQAMQQHLVFGLWQCVARQHEFASVSG